jgi:TRAP-type C4-dicarboxylate transport system substrate-binding protein
MSEEVVHFMTKTLKITVLTLGIGVACLCSPALAQGGLRYAIKFATVAPEGSTWIKHMRTLDREIRTKSDGKIGFRIYPGGIAGDELDVLRKMRIGQIHCAAFSGVGFGQILPEVRVLDLPYLFRNQAETDRVQRELRPFFTNEFRKKGFQLLAWSEVGDVHLLSKHPIRKVSDFSGLKVWTWSGDPIAKETFSAFGIAPIPLALPDVTTALNTGMIDTVYAPPLGALALQWQASLSYIMALPLAHSTGAMLISSRVFGKLPGDLADLLQKSVDRAMTDLTSELRKQSAEAMRLIQQNGLTLVPAPTGAALAQFYHIHDTVARNLTGKLYSKELLDRVYAILGR